MNPLPMTPAELAARLIADRKLTHIRRVEEKRVNIVILDNLKIIRDLGAANLEVWEELA